MLYVDTSVLVACYCPEPLSMTAQSVVSKHESAISHLTEVEFCSAVSRKVRLKELSSEDGHRILALFQTHLDSQILKIFNLDLLHYRFARDWISQMTVSLRTLDALHLSVASLEKLSFVTCDKGMAKAAKSLGMKVLVID